MILSGKLPAKNIKEKIKEKIGQCERAPKLITVSVAPDPSTRSYINSQTKVAKKLGIEHIHKELEDRVSQNELIDVIKRYGKDNEVDGIMLALPLPSKFDKLQVINAINPEKDVEGITNINLGLLFYEKPFFYPCTAEAVLRILDYYNIPLSGNDVTIIGRSTTVGKPLNIMLLERSNNGTPTVCHTRTANLDEKIKQSEILVVAAGKHGVVTSDMLSDDTVVIDVGINFVDGRLVGDVKRDEGVEEKKNISITPVPGGVGAVTTALLMSNVVNRCLSKYKGEKN
jgi:methylenetetrahydrofolate dehydrogenase (NADP+)/methenyltetrahydrofolate cyclohydrolase